MAKCKKCKKCGSKIKGYMLFCPKCGFILSKTAPNVKIQSNTSRGVSWK